MASSASPSGEVRFVGLLAVTLALLKICGVIAWSWWWVLSPIWITTVLALAVLAAAVVIYWIWP